VSCGIAPNSDLNSSEAWGVRLRGVVKRESTMESVFKRRVRVEKSASLKMERGGVCVDIPFLVGVSGLKRDSPISQICI
jgi:hypothetical protein